jgi:BON domain
MFNSQLQHEPVVLNAADADLLLRLGIALSIKKRAGWHLVRMAVQNGVVQLAGVVPSFYDRQLIAALARHVAGVLRVQDELAVGDPSIRQQVENTDGNSGDCDSRANTSDPRNPFLHLPAVSESLEDILAQRAAGLKAAG